MKASFILMIFLSLSFAMFSQRVTEYILPDSALSRASELHDRERYNEAIQMYKKVSPNDPKSAYALKEIAVCFYDLKEYDSSIFYANLSLEKKKQNVLQYAYIIKGKAYIKKEEAGEALKIYEDALKTFPENVNLLHFKGYALQEMKEHQRAIDVYKDVNIRYAGYVKNQLSIAELAANEGLLTQSFLAYCHAMMYSLSSSNSVNILAKMNELAAKKLEENPNNISFSSSGDQFSETETLLKSQAALQSKYKLKSSNLDFPIVRQLDLLFSQLDKYEPTDGYFDKYYVPFYKELYKEGYFDEFIQLLFLHVNDAKIQSQLKKNQTALLNFINWSGKKLATTVNVREIQVEGKKITLPCQFVSGEKRCGEFKDEGKGNGIWYYFHENGNIARFGELKDGKAEGLWNYYYASGKKSGEVNFSNDTRNGTYLSLYESGAKKESSAYKEDSLEGEYITYYSNGNVRSKGIYTNNKSEGIWKYYYRNGKLKTVANFKEDLLDGEYLSYAVDGETVVEKFQYKNGKLDGNQETFYLNGIKKQEATYTDGDKDGEYKEYNIAGVLREIGKYQRGVALDYKEYYDNGNPSSSFIYDKGELEAKETFDYDGNPYARYIFKNDYLKQVILLDKTGKEQSKESIGKNDAYTANWFYTNKRSVIGNYAKGRRTGMWTFYNINGSKDAENTYFKGLKNGIQRTFNEQGNLVSEFQMKDDEYEGYYRRYYESGELKEEGWYIDGTKVGDWYEYNLDGSLKEESYFNDGDLEGKNIEYDADGKLFGIYYFKDGEFLYYETFDKDGKLIQKTEIQEGKSQLPPSSKMSYASYKREKINGWNEGTVYSEPIAGIYDYRGSYTSNYMDKSFVFNFKNGAKQRSSTYALGSLHGKDSFFYINGGVYSVCDLVLGNDYGKYIRYYYNGNTWIERTYVNDVRDSVETIYGINGEILAQKLYKMGYLYGVVKNSDAGELTDTIKVINETVSIEAKYKNGTIGLKEEIKLDNSIEVSLYDDKGTLLYKLLSDENGLLSKKEFFYTSGKLFISESFKKGLDDGEAIYKREDGSTILSVENKQDNYHGSVKIFDESGNLKHHLIYRNGVAYDNVQ